MRLGAYTSDVKTGSLAHHLYRDVVTERHRHRFESTSTTSRADRGRPRHLGRSPERETSSRSSSCRNRAPVVRGRAVPPRVQVDALGQPPAVQVLHRRCTRTPGRAHRKGRRVKLCGFETGLDRPFFLIAGPCVVESEQLQIDVAGALKEITASLGIPFIFSRATTRRTVRAARRFAARAWTRGLRSSPRSSVISACRC